MKREVDLIAEPGERVEVLGGVPAVVLSVKVHFQLSETLIYYRVAFLEGDRVDWIESSTIRKPQQP